MTRSAWCCIAVTSAFTVLGCAQNSPAPISPRLSAPVAASSGPDWSGPFPSPDVTSGDLALVADNGAKVPIGVDEDTFKSAFPRPSITVNATVAINDLPTGATPDHWSASGWQFENGAQGVG